MNISTNLKAIDMIKGEILSEIAHLYRTLADYDEIGDYESVTNENSNGYCYGLHTCKTVGNRLCKHR